MIKSKGENKGREEKKLEISLNDQQTSVIGESWNLFWKIVCMEFEGPWRRLEGPLGHWGAQWCLGNILSFSIHSVVESQGKYFVNLISEVISTQFLENTSVIELLIIVKC